MVEGTQAQQGDLELAALERYRDDCLLAVQAAIADCKTRHGIRD